MPHQVGPWHRVPRDLNVLKLPSTGAGTLPQAQVSQPCRPAPSRTRGKLRHAHGLTFQDIPGSAMVTAPAVPGVPVPNNAGTIAVPLLRFAAATVPSDCDNSANAPATTTPPSKPAALWAVMAMTSESELRTVREKLAPGGFRTPADDPVQDGAVYLGAPISHYPEWMTGALGRRREAHATLLERIASFGTSGYGCHHGAMRLLVVCAVRQTGFLSRMMPPSELDPFLEAVDAANISAAFSLLGLDACDQSTPRMEAAIVQMSMPADFGGLNLALLQSEAPAAFYSAQSVVLPKLVREYGPALGPLYEAVRAEVSSVATSALPWARETRRVYETLPTYWCSGLAT
eukprot:jgi/Tetstr1/460333/TSEL_005633.t1